MAVDDSFLPPVVINIVGTDKDFLATIAVDESVLTAWAKQTATANLGVSTKGVVEGIAEADEELAAFARKVYGSAIKLNLDNAAVTAGIAEAELKLDVFTDKTWYAGIGAQVNNAQVAATLASLDATIAAAHADMTVDLVPNLGEAALAGAVAGAAGNGGGGGASGLLAALGWGGGKGLFGLLGGMASFGSILSLMGFGAEHVAATGVGIAGSMAGAGLGAGFLGLGALGTGAVGMGTDMAGIGQAVGDIQTYGKLQSNLAQATAVYGKTSTEYKLAQYQYQQWAKYMSATTIKAITQASQMATAFHTMFDKVSAEAETTGAQIITQAMQVGMTFLPTIGKFAAQNMGIIKADLQPFFAWLKTGGGSGGLGIFTNLEKVFQSELPTAMHALEQGFELLAKTITIASKYGGRFISWINEFLTRMNGATFSKWSHFVNDMITSFNAWFGLLKSMGGVIYDLFEPAVGLGDQVARLLTTIFDQIGSWLKGDHSLLHGLFTAHAKELITGIGGIIKAVLPIIEQFVNAFVGFATGGAVIATVALKGIAGVLGVINKIPFADTILGWGAAVAFFGPKVATGVAALASWAARLAGLSGDTSIVVNGLSSLGGAIKAAGTAVADFALGAAANIGTFVSGFAGRVASVASGFASMIAAGASWAAETAAQIARSVASFIVMAAEWVAGAAVFIASNVAMAAAAVAAFVAENIATLGIIAGIAAIVAAIIYLATHWTQVWNDIKGWTDDAWKDIQGKGNNIIGILLDIWSGGLLPLAAHWTAVWGGIKAAAGAVWHFLDGTFFQPIANFFNTVITGALDAAKSAWDTVWTGIKSTVQAVWGVLQPIFNDISGAIKTIAGGLSSIGSGASSILGDLNPLGGHFLGIPGLAEGGLVSKPTLAIVGEAGPELVIPLSQLSGVSTTASTIGPLPPITGASSFGGYRTSAPTITLGPIYIQGVPGTPQKMVPAVQAGMQGSVNDIVRRLQAGSVR